jgi:hypothetical protein
MRTKHGALSLLLLSSRLCGAIVLDVPTSPLKLTSDSENFYQVENRSKVDVKAFRLGCVHTENGGKSIRFLFPRSEKAIEPGEAFYSLKSHGTAGEIAQCKALNSQLAVVEVWTGDDGAWFLDVQGAEMGQKSQH